MPKSRAAMHLDTVFTFGDRDLVTVYKTIVDEIPAGCPDEVLSAAKSAWKEAYSRADLKSSAVQRPPRGASGRGRVA